ncbi:MAG: hypothetical protein VXW15_02175 [Bdellovibrionota bacterium]|nr:hypothetical protein [Bdellovibrionota bacterium]
MKTTSLLLFLLVSVSIEASCPGKSSLPCKSYNQEKNIYQARYKKRNFTYEGVLNQSYKDLKPYEKQGVLWQEIVKSEISPSTNLWDSSFILKGLGGRHGVSHSLHAWAFETDAIKPGGKKKGKSVKFTHTHGVVAKCNFVIKIKYKKAVQHYTGLFSLDKNTNKIPCLIRLSILNMQDFGPGVAIKLFQEKGPSINNHFLYRLEGFRPKEIKNFFSHMLRTELPVMDFDGKNIITKMFQEAKETALNRYLPKRLSPTVVATEHLSPKLNQIAPKDKSFRKFGGYEGGVFHRPLHVNAGHPNILKPLYPRHLALVSEGALNLIKGDPKENFFKRNMGVKGFRKHLIRYGKALRSKNWPLYKVYAQHKFMPCHDNPKENDKEPFCTYIKDHTFKVRNKGMNNVDQYAEVYLTSDFKASAFGDKYLNFQHTF